MKKSVILILIGIYLLSIFVVGYFGMKYAVYNETIYVNQIKILDVIVDGNSLELKQGEDCPYAVTEYKEGLVVFISYKVLPTDATSSRVKFVYDTTSTTATVSDSGIVTFNKSGAITVTIKATDGSNRTAAVRIYAR